MTLKKRAWGRYLIMLLILLTVLTACGSTTPAQSTLDLQALSQQFSDDLSLEILQYRENPEWMQEIGVLVNTSSATYGGEHLAAFQKTLQTKEDSAITIAFQKSGLVLYRIGIMDGKYYYLRYEYDDSNPEQIPVTAYELDTLEMDIQPDGKKAEIRMTRAKAKTITFSFNNIITIQEE